MINTQLTESIKNKILHHIIREYLPVGTLKYYLYQGYDVSQNIDLAVKQGIRINLEVIETNNLKITVTLNYDHNQKNQRDR